MQAAQAARITPAGAGKTLTREAGCDKIKDHPRRCGENHIPHRGVYSLSGSPPQVRGKQPEPKEVALKKGSPPQVRGKHSALPHIRAATRITPAGAGKTVRGNRLPARARDHPRRCGENKTEPKEVALKKGSPPQVRGKPEEEASERKVRRITPAGAGKTLKRSFRNQPFCSRAVQISFNFSNSLNVSLQSGSAR